MNPHTQKPSTFPCPLQPIPSAPASSSLQILRSLPPNTHTSTRGNLLALHPRPLGPGVRPADSSWEPLTLGAPSPPERAAAPQTAGLRRQLRAVPASSLLLSRVLCEAPAGRPASAQLQPLPAPPRPGPPPLRPGAPQGDGHGREAAAPGGQGHEEGREDLERRRVPAPWAALEVLQSPPRLEVRLA